jgi:hypothetical protein
VSSVPVQEVWKFPHMTEEASRSSRT